MSIETITPRSLAELCKNGKPIDFIDVRTPMEFRELHVPQARNISLDQLDPVAVMEARSGSREEPLYFICRSGSRGRQACEKFLAAGYPNVVNVEGGTLAWAACWPARRPRQEDRSHWSGKSAWQRDRWCYWGPCSAGWFIPRSLLWQPLSVPACFRRCYRHLRHGACCWPGCRGTGSRMPVAAPVQTSEVSELRKFATRICARSRP